MKNLICWAADWKNEKELTKNNLSAYEIEFDLNSKRGSNSENSYILNYLCKIVSGWAEGNELHPMIPLDNAVTFNALSIIDLTVMVIYIPFIKWE